MSSELFPSQPRPSNPFRSATTRPGQLDYLSAESGLQSILQDAAQVISRHPRSLIHGPHGSGKTTLLLHLSRFLLRDPLAGWAPQAIHRLTWRIKQSPPEYPRVLQQLTAGDLLIVDGFEQCRWYHRLAIFRHCSQRRIRLLATSHRPLLGFHVLVQTKPDRRIAERLFETLIEDFPEYRCALGERFETRWQASGGNFRQLWSMLYDDFEQLAQTPRPIE